MGYQVGHAPSTKLAHIQTSSNKRYKSLQGLFNPRSGGPYRGNIKQPKFRSKIELRLMTMLDSPNANNVVAWNYECKKIPYQDKSTTTYSNGLPHHPTRQYVIDFVVTVRNPSGNTNTFWIETKSIHDIAVNKTKRRTKNAKISEQIRVKNFSKWIAAKKAAESCGAHFIVITENELETLRKMIFGT